MEGLLGGIDNNQKFTSAHPVVFIMGCARSGTTLFSQLLATATDWCYPSNLISRFYYAPYVGSLIQKMLFELDSKGELLGEYKHDIGLSSQLGKTKDALSPHEFWYYWRRFFNFGETQEISEEKLKEVDSGGFINGLKAIQSVFDAPLFLKGMILNWHIPFLAELFPDAYFVHIVRDARFNAQSLLRAREKFFGDIKEWYSFKPPEYYDLVNLSPEEQVVYQVHYTNLAIKRGISSLAQERVATIEYEMLCKKPKVYLTEVIRQVTSTEPNSTLTNIQLKDSNQVWLPNDQWRKIEQVAGQLA